MARKKLPARDSRGRFKKGSRSSRSSRSRTRRNPGRMKKNPPDIMGMAVGGATTATQVLLGKAATRSVPELANLPRSGNTGLAVQALVAIALGYISAEFLSREAAAAILAGGLTAPLEDFIVAQNVPWLSEALGPGASPTNNVGRYPQRPALVAGYPDGGVGRYPTPPGVGRYPEAHGELYDPEAWY